MTDMTKHISFTLTDAEKQLCVTRDGREVFTVCFSDGEVRAALSYTANERPLYLRGEAAPGDEIRLVLRDYRIELYVNGEIKDEEWPWGEALFCGGGAEKILMPADIRELPMPEKKEQPAVIGHITGAEGWYPGGGVFVGDCMPYVHGGRYHVLWLKDRHHHKAKWGKGAHQWEHISTADLVNWDIHPMAVEIDDPSEGSICTGSHIFDGGRHYLYYTVRKSDGSPATIQRSISEDGWHFSKDRDFAFTLSEKYHRESARDPKVIRGADGLLHMFVTTSEVAIDRGALAHLVSRDGGRWEELPESIYISPDGSQPECSDYFEYRGRYYLIFSHHGKGQYLISDRPFDGWREPKEPHIPCSSVPKAGVFKGERIIFTGFKGMGGYAGSMTFLEADTDENGEMRYFPVREMA